MSSLRQRLRLIESVAPRAQLTSADFFVIGAIIGLASKVYSSYGKQDDQLPLGSQISPPQLANLDVEGPSLFKVGPHARELQAFINSLSQSDTVRAQPTSSTVLSALDDAALAIKQARGQEILSAEVLDARAQLVEAIQSVLQETEGFTVEPVDPLLALTRLSDEEQPAPNESPGSVDSEQGDSLSATDPSSDELDGFDLDTDQGYEVASGIADLSIASVDPSSLGLGGFLPAGAVGGGGGGGGGVEGVFVADLPSAPAAPAGPSAPSGSPSFSSSPTATPTPTPTPPTPPASFGGRVVDGYVIGATVFYDQDNDGIFDEGEISTVTKGDGSFSFSAEDSAHISSRPGGGIVILPGGIDSNTGQPVGMLTSQLGEAGKVAISSPLTLILSRYPEIDETNLVAQLGITGLSEPLLYFDPVLEMENAQGNPELAERVFTLQQQVFSIIQSAAVVAGKTVGVAGLDAAVQAVGDAVVRALASGSELTLAGLSQEAITTVTQQAGLSDRAPSIIAAINLVNDKIGTSYSGLAEALSNRSNAQEAEDAIQTLSQAKAAAAASQEVLLQAIEDALTTSFDAAFSTRLDAAIESKVAVFEQILTAENSTGSNAQSEFGNPAFLVANANSQTGTKDIVDLAGAIGGVSLAQLQALGVAHVRLVGTNTAVELLLGEGAKLDVITQDDPDNALDDGFFAQNYTVTLRVTSDQVKDVATYASRLIAAGIDVLKPASGSLTLTLAEAGSLIDAGFQFSSGLVRLSPTTEESGTLNFDEVFRYIDAGLKLSDSPIGLLVEIPEGDSRATYSNIQMLASNGVRFSGGEVQLQARDIARSPYALQFELLEAARSNLTFDVSALDPNWALGKSGDLAFSFPITLSVADAQSLLRAGLPLHNAQVDVSSSADVTLLLGSAYDLLAGGVRVLNFAGQSISFAQAEAVLEAVGVLRNAGESFDRPVFQNAQLTGTEGVSLATLNTALSQGLTLPASFAPDYSQALELVGLGSSFPGGLLIRALPTGMTSITSMDDAERLVAAGVRFENIELTIATSDTSLSSFSADGTETADLARMVALAQAGLRFTFAGDNAVALQTITADPDLNPVFVSITDANVLLGAGVLFDGTTLVVPGAAQFTAIASTTQSSAGRTASQWEAAGFDTIAITSALQPTFNQVKAVVDAGLKLASVRVTAGGAFESNTAPISIRVTTAAELASLSASGVAEAFFRAGIQSVDVLGLTLDLASAQRFIGGTTPAVINASLNLTSGADVEAAADIAYDLFLSGIRSVSVAESVSASAGTWNKFLVARDAVESTLSGTQFSSIKIFSGGTISGAQGINSGVGEVISQLTQGGLRLSETYQPSKEEVLEFLNASGTNRYSKPILLSLEEGESLSLADAELMAGRGVRFATGTVVSLDGVADGSSAADEQALASKFLSLLSGGLRLQDFGSGVDTLTGVTVTKTQADALIAGGIRFSDATLVTENATQLTGVVGSAGSLATRGITKIGLATGVPLTFGQAQQIIDAGLAIDAVSRSSASAPYTVAASAVITIRATSASQLGAVSPLALKAGGIDQIDLASIPISWSAAQRYIGSDLALQNAVLAVGTATEFAQASAKVSELYDLGFRSLSLGGRAVEAADALKFLNISDDKARDFSFSEGTISGSQGVLAADLNNKLTELRTAGLNPGPDFRPDYQVSGSDAGLSGSEQSDATFYETLLSKGFRLVFPEGGGEKELTGVYLTLPQVTRLSSTNAGGLSFAQTTLVVDSSARLDALYAFLAPAVGAGGSLPNGVSTIGLVGGLTPTLAQALTFASKSLSLGRLELTSGSYASSATQAVTVRVGTQSELNDLTDLQLRGLLETGVTALNISGLTLSLARAEQIVAAQLSVTFVGGSLTLTEAELAEETMSDLAPYTALGLSLPSGVAASGLLTLDFALNSYRGSLAKAWVNIGEGPITADQFFALMGRGLAKDAGGQEAIVGTAEQTTLSLGTTSISLSTNQAQAMLQAGVDRVTGETSVLNAVALTAATRVVDKVPVSLDLTNLTATGTTTLQRAKDLDSRDVGLAKVVVDLEGSTVGVADALALLDEGSTEALSGFRNGSLLVGQGANAITAEQALLLKGVGLTSFRVDAALLPTADTLAALGTQGFALVGSYSPTAFSSMLLALADSGVDATLAKVSSLNATGTIDPLALASVDEAVLLATTLVKGSKLNLSGVQVSLAGSEDALSLTNATTLLTGTFLGSALPSGQRPIVGTTSNSVLSVTADETTLSLALATQLKQAGISAVSESLTVAQATAFHGQGFLFDASLTSGRTANFNDAVALSSAIAVPSTAGLSLKDLKVTVSTPVALISSLTLAQKGVQFVTEAGVNLSDGRLLVVGNEAITDLDALSTKGFATFQLASGTTTVSATLREALKLVDTSSGEEGVQKLSVSGALTRAQVEALKDHFEFAQATLASGQTATIVEATDLARITGLEIKGLVVQASGITSTDRDLLSAKGVQLLNVTIGDEDLTVARALDYANAGLTFTAASLRADQEAGAEAAAKLASVAGLSLNGLLANSAPTVAQALVLQSKSIEYASDVTLVPGQQASVAQALVLADVPGLSIAGLRVSTGTLSAIDDAEKLIKEGVVFSGIQLASGQVATPAYAVLLANAQGLTLTGLVVSGTELSPSQALTLASEGLSLQGKVVGGEVEGLEGLTQALNLARVPGLSLAGLTLGTETTVLDMTAPQALGLIARGVHFANAFIKGEGAGITVSSSDAVLLSQAPNLDTSAVVVAGATVSSSQALALSAAGISLSGKALALGSLATVAEAEVLSEVNGLSISGLTITAPEGTADSLTSADALTYISTKGVVFGPRVSLSDDEKTIPVAEAVTLIKAGLELSAWFVEGPALAEQSVALSAENIRLVASQQSPMDLTGMFTAQITSIEDDGGVVGDRLTNDASPVLTVRAESGAILKLVQKSLGDGGVPTEVVSTAYQVREVADSEVGADGWSTYTITVLEGPSQGLSSGVYGVQVIDGAGNAGLVTDLGPDIFKIDLDQPRILDVAVDSDNADSTLAKAGDNVTLAFSVSGPPLDGLPTVSIFGRDATVSQVTEDLTDGLLRYEATMAIVPEDNNGPIIFAIDVTDTAGNKALRVSTPTNSEVTVTVDTVAPSPPTLTLAKASDTGYDDSDLLTRDDTPTLIVSLPEGTSEGDDLQIFNGDSVAPVFTKVLTAEDARKESIAVALESIGSDGDKSLTARLIDAANNQGTLSNPLTFFLDTEAPNVAAEVSEVSFDTSSLASPKLIIKLESDSSDLMNIDVTLGSGSSVYQVPYESEVVVEDISSFGLNPDSVLKVALTDKAGNSTLLVGPPISTALFFGAVVDENIPTPRANFSNLGLLAAEADERSSFAFIDAGLGYVISDNADLNNLEIAEGLGVMGSMGDDYMVARDQGSVLAGGSGNDTLLGGLSQDYLDGEDGDDIFVPLGAADVIRTGSGNDLIEISADAFYEQISRAQMEDLLLRVTQADIEGVRSILDQLKTAQEASLAETGAESAIFENRFVGVVQDFSNTDDAVEFFGFSDAQEVVAGRFSMSPSADQNSQISYQFVKEFANPVGSEDPDYIFTSIMLSSDANAWTMAAVEEETPKS